MTQREQLRQRGAVARRHSQRLLPRPAAIAGAASSAPQVYSRPLKAPRFCCTSLLLCCPCPARPPPRPSPSGPEGWAWTDGDAVPRRVFTPPPEGRVSAAVPDSAGVTLSRRTWPTVTEPPARIGGRGTVTLCWFLFLPRPEHVTHIPAPGACASTASATGILCPQTSS